MGFPQVRNFIPGPGPVTKTRMKPAGFTCTLCRSLILYAERQKLKRGREEEMRMDLIILLDPFDKASRMKINLIVIKLLN